MVKKPISKKSHKKKTKSDMYCLTLPCRKEPSLEEIIDWLKAECKGYYHYNLKKKYVNYEFKDIDDAFRFKMRFTRV